MVQRELEEYVGGIVDRAVHQKIAAALGDVAWPEDEFTVYGWVKAPRAALWPAKLVAQAENLHVAHSSSVIPGRAGGVPPRSELAMVRIAAAAVAHSSSVIPGDDQRCASPPPPVPDAPPAPRLPSARCSRWKYVTEGGGGRVGSSDASARSSCCPRTVRIRHLRGVTDVVGRAAEELTDRRSATDAKV